MKFSKLFISLLLLANIGGFANELSAKENNNNSATTARAQLSFPQIKIAAERGDPDAQYAVGYMYYYGKGGAPKDTSLAKKWIGKAAAQKQPQATRAMALMNGQRQGFTEQQERNQLGQSQPTTQSQPSSAMTTHNSNNMTTSPRSLTAEKEVVIKKTKPVTIVTHHSVAHQPVTETAATFSSKGIYTLQLLGAYKQDPIDRLITTYHLQDKAMVYRTTFNNKDWYVLLYGQYDTKTEAELVAKKLATNVAVEPWIKPLAAIKQYQRCN